MKRQISRVIAVALSILTILSCVILLRMDVQAASVSYGYSEAGSTQQSGDSGRGGKKLKVNFWCGAKCGNIAGTYTKTSNTGSFTYTGGTITFQYLANDCSEVKAYGTVKAINTETNESYTIVNNYRKSKNNTWVNASFTLPKAGQYKLTFSCKFTGSHNSGEYCGFWVRNISYNQPKFAVTYIDKILSNDEVLGQTTRNVDWGATAAGSDIGSLNTISAYYTGYSYVSCTTATVTENGATVYRYFEPAFIILFDDNGGSGGPGSTTINGQGNIPSTVPTREGYKFMGWGVSDNWCEDRFAYSTDKGGLTARDNTIATITANDWKKAEYASALGIDNIEDSITVYAQWELLEVDYTIKHWKENLDSDKYELADTEKESAVPNTNVTPPTKTYEGFRSPELQTVIVSSDGSTVVNYYYVRNMYPVIYIDVVNSESGEELGRTTRDMTYGQIVDGSDIGDSKADNAYYNAYYLERTTSAIVNIDGATVYRIFKLKTTDSVKGTVSWKDNHNIFETRPDNVTVTLYRKDVGKNIIEKIDTWTGLAESDSNDYSFPELQVYSKEDGEPYVYSVTQSPAISQTAPTDKYVTTQNSFDFVNNLGNTYNPEKPDEGTDPDGKGLYIQGNIHWDDNGNTLGYRPKTVTISLYRAGKEGIPVDNNGCKIPFKEVEVNSFDDNYYEFIQLPKYWYDENGDQQKYEYTVGESLVAVYGLSDGTVVDAYTISADTPVIFDFTNIFNIVDEPINPIKDYDNTLIVKTNLDNPVDVVLKGLEEIINSDLTVSYGDYSGRDYIVKTDNEGSVVNHIPCGKYEILFDDTRYDIKDITIYDEDHMKLIKEDEKYYLVVEDWPGDGKGTLDIFLVPKELRYCDKNSYYNYFAAINSKTANQLMELQEMSEFYIEAINTYSIVYENSETEDKNQYYPKNIAVVLGYEGKNKNNFIGWTDSEKSNVIKYYENDEIEILNDEIILWPVFKEKSEVEIDTNVETDSKTEQESSTETNDEIIISEKQETEK